MHETILEYSFNRIIPFLYQFGTSGNEIGKAKSQFSKHKTVFAKWSLNFANFTSVCAKFIWEGVVPTVPLECKEKKEEKKKAK